jgi:hypothetical protein
VVRAGAPAELGRDDKAAQGQTPRPRELGQHSHHQRPVACHVQLLQLSCPRSRHREPLARCSLPVAGAATLAAARGTAGCFRLARRRRCAVARGQVPPRCRCVIAGGQVHGRCRFIVGVVAGLIDVSSGPRHAELREATEQGQVPQASDRCRLNGQVLQAC